VGVIQQYGSKADHQLLFKQWGYYGQAKIALKIQSDEEMVGRGDCEGSREWWAGGKKGQGDGGGFLAEHSFVIPSS
jgi:hypothetical protein